MRPATYLTATLWPFLHHLASATPVLTPSPLYPLPHLRPRSAWLTGHAKLYVGTPMVGGELYMDPTSAIGKSDGSTEACTVAVTVPFNAESCTCTVVTGAVYNGVTCVADMVPDGESGGIDLETGKYPSSVKITWRGSYIFSS